MTLVLALFWIAIAVALLQSFRIIQLKRENRFLMSKNTELTAATDKAISVIQSLTQNSTPDSEVQAQADKLNAASDAAIPPTPTP